MSVPPVEPTRVVSGSGGGWSETSLPNAEPPPPGSRTAEARYQRTAVLGRGGMGTVFGVHDALLQRSVALKVATHGSKELRARLEREAKVLAALDHPAIVSVLDAGFDDDQAPYYVMPQITGQTLAAAIDSAAEDAAARVALLRPFATVCDAVAHAHTRGIVHRDIKPANIMLGDFGRTWVVDWGLARAVDRRAEPQDGQTLQSAPDHDLTLVGSIVGTPRFMSPQQRLGEAPGPRDDVWSLGAVLHMIVFTAAPRDRPARRSSTTPPPELQAILDRALAEDPGERYPNASALAEDVHRFIDGGWVQAYSYSGWHYVVTLVRMYRRRLVLGAAMILFAALSLGVGWLRTVDERERALAAESRAKQSAHVSRLARADARDALDEANLSLQQALIGRSWRASRIGADAPAELLALEALQRGASPRARGVLAALPTHRRPRLIQRQPLPRCAQIELRASGQQALCVNGGHACVLDIDSAQEQPRALHRWTHPSSGGRFAAGQFSADGVVLLDSAGAMYSAQGAAEPVLLPYGETPRILAIPSRASNTAFTVGGRLHWGGSEGQEVAQSICAGMTQELRAVSAPSGSQLAGLCSDGNVFVGRWPRPDRFQITRQVELPGAATGALAFSEDERELWVGVQGGQVFAADLTVDDRVRRYTSNVGSVRHVAGSRDGRRLAIAGERVGIEVLDRATGTRLWTLPQVPPRGVAFAGPTELVIATDELLHYALPEDSTPVSFVAEAGLASAVVSPDGTLVAGVDGSGHLYVWDRATGRPVHTDRWQELVAKDVAFSSDGATLTVVAMSGGIHQISTQTWARKRLPCPEGTHRRIAWLGDVLVALTFGGGPQLLEGALSCRRVTDRLPVDWSDLGAAPDATALVLLDERSGRVGRMRAGFVDTIDTILWDQDAVAVDIAVDGTVAVARRHDVYLVDELGDRRTTLAAHGEILTDVAIRGPLVAAATVSGKALVWDRASGALLALLEGHTERVATVKFDATGQWLVTASWDRHVRLWDLKTLREAPGQRIVQAQADWGLGLDELLALDLR